jgi:uncharacterized phage-associated protein
MTVQLETAKLLAPCLYVLQKMGRLTKHHLSKVLYTADKLHIATYGRTLTGDIYVAMQNGPVPSRLYDFIKVVQGKSDGAYVAKFVKYLPEFIAFNAPYYVVAKQAPNMDFLSRSAIEALDTAINTVGPMSFRQRTDFTHDEAWKSVHLNEKIPLTEIAKAAGANEAMIDYIKATN